MKAFMPHRTLQKDGSVIEGFAERPMVDALHGPTGNKEPLIAYHFRTRENGSCFEETDVNVTRASVGGSGGAKLAMHTQEGVRRLTPVECERLQGFPDHWTAYGPDSRRYAALGDAVTVNVAEWIGRRMMEAES